MDEAKRLNMLDGHFFWMWIDATRKIDVFRNISDRNQHDDSDVDLDRVRDEDETLAENRSERSKRDDADNNTLTELNNTSVTLTRTAKHNLSNDRENIVKNSSLNSFNRRISRNISKLEAHSVNDKLLYGNISQSFDSSRNISSKNLRNNVNVNNKGVETSKIENNSIEKGKKSFLSKNKSSRNSNSRMRNESFNKYVNSINVEDVNIGDTARFEDNSDDKPSEVRNNLLFSSDISDFLMNPTVHTSTLRNVRDKEKRNDKRAFRIELNNEEQKNQDNITDIFNSLPIGLLALSPQPMKVGKSIHFYSLHF